jgi:hypothetical protein
MNFIPVFLAEIAGFYLINLAEFAEHIQSYVLLINYMCQYPGLYGRYHGLVRDMFPAEFSKILSHNCFRADRSAVSAKNILLIEISDLSEK